MGQSRFCPLTWERRLLCNPVSEGRPKPVHGVFTATGDGQSLRQSRIAEGLRFQTRKKPIGPWVREQPDLIEDFQRCLRKRHAMGVAGLHAGTWNTPICM